MSIFMPGLTKVSFHKTNCHTKFKKAQSALKFTYSRNNNNNNNNNNNINNNNNNNNNNTTRPNNNQQKEENLQNCRLCCSD